jgi:LacI family transcriptional regulator
MSTVRRNSIRDVAVLAAVSVGTVSNVLNKPELVTPSTRERVLAAVAELGFVRNGAARSLRAGESRVVGAIVLDIGNPFFTDVARGVEDRLAQADRVLVLCSSDGDPARTTRYLNLLREQDLHGLLVTPTGGLDDLRVVAASGVPVVLLDRHANERDFCSVAVDDVKGGQLAASHLFDQGHRRIGFLNGPVTTQACADRRKGVRAACRKAGLDVATALVELTPGLNSAAGELGTETLLQLAEPVTAIACVNDLVALGVLRALNRHHVSVPDDMAVIGYDDVEFASELSTPLSSVAQPRYAIGRTAAELLLTEASERVGHEHRQVRYQPELVIRESSLVSR